MNKINQTINAFLLLITLTFSVYGEGQKLYVDLNGGNNYPYDSWENAARSLQDALAIAEDDAVITVRSGEYEYSGLIALTNAVTVISENKDYNSVKLICKEPVNKSTFVKVDNAGAKLSSISLTGSKKNANVLYVNNGTVTNCFVHNVTPERSYPAVVLKSGTIIDSVFSKLGAFQSSGSIGVISISGETALLERCRILDCEVTRYENGCGAAINISNGIVTNCFVSGCISSGYGGGIYASGTAKVYHTTVVNCKAVYNGGGIYKSGSSVVVEDCIEWNNLSASLIDNFDDPGFVDSVNGDFRLNKASYYAGAGCYALAPTDDISIAFTRNDVFAPCAVSLRAVAPSGTNLDGAQSYWTFDGSEPSADNYDAKGTDVTYTIAETGTVTVKFKTVANGNPVSINKPDWIMTLSKTIYLREKNENANAPYISYDTAATTFTEALKYLREGVTLLVDEGKYELRAVRLNENAVIQSLKGPLATIVDGKADAFHLINGAVVSGFKFINGSSNTGRGIGCMEIKNGMVTNCVFDGINSLRETAVKMSGGMIVDSVFTNCYNNGNYDGMGSAAIVLEASSGLIERSVFTKSFRQDGAYPTKSPERAPTVVLSGTAKIRSCVFDDCMSYNGGALWVRSGASAENCTILNSEAQNEGYAAGIRTDSGAIVKNCIAVMNTNSYASAEMNIAVADGATVERCVSTENAGTDPVAVPSVLFSAKKNAKKYSLPSGSPLRDKGVYDATWMDAAKDFYGTPRKFGAGVDIGAVECDRPYGMVIILQ